MQRMGRRQDDGDVELAGEVGEGGEAGTVDTVCRTSRLPSLGGTQAISEKCGR